jgi:hypothetical protein
MRYFVTVNSEVVSDNLNREQAIKLGLKKCSETKSTLQVGIGRWKYYKGKWVYTCLPLHFYIN